MPPAPAILIVEDERTLREELSELLKTLNYQCFCADNGLAALHILESEAIDILLCDVNLSGEDGVNLVKRLHDHDNRLLAGLGVVMMTGHTDLVESVRGNIDQLCDAFLLKPVRLRDLRAVLDRVIARVRADVA